MSTTIRRVIPFVLLLSLLSACAGGADSGGSSSAGTEGVGGADVREALAPQRAVEGIADVDAGDNAEIGYAESKDATLSQGGGGDSFQGGSEGQSSTRLDIGPAIIKTATVRVAIDSDRFRSAVHSATSLAERYGGYVVSTTVDEHGKGFAAATLRIPSDKFGAAMGAVRGLGTIRSEEISGDDVTQQVIDLEARLRNLSAQEAVLLRLMDQARTVVDTIRVQQHLTDVQLEVERIKGRLSYLDDQVSFSTIFVEMTETGASDGVEAGIIGRAWERAVDGALAVIGGVIVGAGFVTPLALLALIAALAYRVLRARTAKRLTSAG